MSLVFVDGVANRPSAAQAAEIAQRDGRDYIRKQGRLDL